MATNTSKREDQDTFLRYYYIDDDYLVSALSRFKSCE